MTDLLRTPRAKRGPSLRLAPSFALPVDAATRRMAILAMSGAGKSNVAVVLAEAMHDAGIPWVAIDPKGDWWGIRSNQSGKGPGLPVPIFGGLKGDLPLAPTAGKLIAELIIAQRLTCVLDVSEFESRQGMWGFLADLGTTLLRKNRDVLHLFLEEADEYLPQKPNAKGNLLDCLGVWQRVVKRGRFRGIGTTQITQRSASLNKDTLYQAELLIAMRVAGKGDREAVRGWVEHHNAAKEIVDSLPSLHDGEGWVSSPAWLRETIRIPRFDRRRTFDSGVTPILAKGSTKPATLADVDLAKLETEMAATIEQAKADDPRELRKEIAELHKERTLMLKRDAARRSEKATRLVEVPTFPPAATELLADLGVALDQARQMVAAAFKHAEAVDRLRMKTQRDAIAIRHKHGPSLVLDIPALPREIMGSPPPPKVERREWSQRGRVHVMSETPRKGQEAGLTRGQQKILNALAELEALGVTAPGRRQLGAMAGYNLTGGTGAQHLADLASAGLVTAVGGVVSLTAEGRAVADSGGTPGSLAELHQRILVKLTAGQRRIAETLIAIYPDAISRADLGSASGYNLTGGTGAQHLADLVTVGAARIPGPGKVTASDMLFPKELR